MPIQDTDRLPTIAAFLIIIVLMAGFVPSLIDNTSDIATQTVTQTEGNEYQLTGYLNADLTNVRDGMSFTEVASIHTTNTDFNGATALENMTVGDGDVSLESPEEETTATTSLATDSSPGTTGTTSSAVGMHFDPSTDLAGIDVVFDEDVAGASTVSIVRESDGATVHSETWTGPGEYSIDQSLSESETYWVQAGADGGSYTYAFEDETYPITSGNADIISSGGSDTSADNNDALNVESITFRAEPSGSGTYVSETHSVNGAETGFTNITLSNAEATVTWIADTDGDGTFETEVDESVITTTGNYTTDLSGTSGQNFRVNVTFSITGSSPSASLHDDGILTTTTSGTDVNVTLVDTKTGQTVDTGPINESETKQFTIGFETVTVTNEDVLSGNRSLLTYEYPRYYGYNPIVAQFGGLIGLIILVIFVYLMYSIFFPEEKQ